MAARVPCDPAHSAGVTDRTIRGSRAPVSTARRQRGEAVDRYSGRGTAIDEFGVVVLYIAALGFGLIVAAVW